MPGFLDQCAELFETNNLYDILGVSKEADSAKREPKKPSYELCLSTLVESECG